jgi:hypothetical protein
MGTWAIGAFENDDAADFLAEAEASPARAVSAALRAVTKAPAGSYFDVDVGAPARAAAELVALSFGYGPPGDVAAAVTATAARLRPTEAQRALALSALPRIADAATSELAALWQEGAGGASLVAALDDLRARLEAAAAGARAVPRLEAGDVVALDAEPGVVAVQVVGAHEAAVFAGTFADDAAALAALAGAPARRVVCETGVLLRAGRVLARLPLRKDLRGRGLYAMESGAMEGYLLCAASGAGMREASYAEALARDAHEQHSVAALRAVARDGRPPARVRSPEVREAALRAAHREEWARRRAETTPGPFGDPAQLATLAAWMREYGVENAVRQHVAIARGSGGYGRPSEPSERRPYAFAGIVALWLGRWPADAWPASLAGELPPRPKAALLREAHSAARALADAVVTRDAALRMIWDDDAANRARLRAEVDALRDALR